MSKLGMSNSTLGFAILLYPGSHKAKGRVLGWTVSSFWGFVGKTGILCASKKRVRSVNKIRR